MPVEAIPCSWGQVHAFRLRRHHLDRPAQRGALIEVVRDTCGIQSQVPSAAELALRARVKSLRRDDVRRALENDRTLVRGWMVRGAVHLVPADDFLLYTRALSARVDRTLRWLRLHGRNVEAFEATIRCIVEALEEGPLARRALADRVVARLGEGARDGVQHSWGGLVVDACMRGLVAFGPERGNDVTFVSRESWLPEVRDFSPEEAGSILLRRYLRAFGPASPRDFAQWAYIPMANVREVWARIERELVSVRAGDAVGSVLKEDLRPLQKEPPARTVVRLLPTFDAYLLGHKDKGHLVDAAHYKHVYRKAGWLSPVVLVNGRAAGVWSIDRKGGVAVLRIDPFQEMSRAVREGVKAEASDIGRFLEMPAETVFR